MCIVLLLLHYSIKIVFLSCVYGFIIVWTVKIQLKSQKSFSLKFWNYLVFFPLTEDASKKHPFPCPCTYRTALSHYLDITSIPRTNVIKDIAEYATDQKDKDFLLLLSSSTPEGKVNLRKARTVPVIPFVAYFYCHDCFKNLYKLPCFTVGITSLTNRIQ